MFNTQRHEQEPSPVQGVHPPPLRTCGAPTTFQIGLNRSMNVSEVSNVNYLVYSIPPPTIYLDNLLCFSAINTRSIFVIVIKLLNL